MYSSYPKDVYQIRFIAYGLYGQIKNLYCNVASYPDLEETESYGQLINGH